MLAFRLFRWGNWGFNDGLLFPRPISQPRPCWPPLGCVPSPHPPPRPRLSPDGRSILRSSSSWSLAKLLVSAPVFLAFQLTPPFIYWEPKSNPCGHWTRSHAILSSNLSFSRHLLIRLWSSPLTPFVTRLRRSEEGSACQVCLHPQAHGIHPIFYSLKCGRS